jgi:hypothetical protein
MHFLSIRGELQIGEVQFTFCRLRSDRSRRLSDKAVSNPANFGRRRNV